MLVEVFLSYAREDSKIAKRIVDKLKRESVLVWWDNKIMPDAADFRHEIKQAIEAARCCLVLWSPASCDSNWVNSEAVTASHSRAKVLHLALGSDINVPMPHNSGNIHVIPDHDEQAMESKLDFIVSRVKDAIGIVGPK